MTVRDGARRRAACRFEQSAQILNEAEVDLLGGLLERRHENRATFEKAGTMGDRRHEATALGTHAASKTCQSGYTPQLHLLDWAGDPRRVFLNVPFDSASEPTFIGAHNGWRRD